VIKLSSCMAAAALTAFASYASAQGNGFEPATSDVLLNPPPGDWLMVNRTYDEQRFSPLNQINKDNVSQLRMAWSRGLTAGTIESTPLVYQGVMYVVAPGAGVLAVDATTGDTIWEYFREMPKDAGEFIRSARLSRQKGLAFFEDMVITDASDGFIVALDAKTGKVRWETKAHDYKDGTEHTSAPIVADGKVITGRTCTKRAGCFIAAHDAKTGKELWKFYHTAAPGEQGGDTCGQVPVEE
jgi:alcohol dehydrogenase (cytochrome c)